MLELDENGRLLAKPAVPRPVRFGFLSGLAKTTQNTICSLSNKELIVQCWTETSAPQLPDQSYRRRYYSNRDAPHRQTFPSDLT